MPRTPDRLPGPFEEDEEIRLIAPVSGPASPSQAGAINYNGSFFQMRDDIGVFNPRPDGHSHTLVGDVIGNVGSSPTSSVVAIRGVTVSTTVPTQYDAMVYTGSNWTPGKLQWSSIEDISSIRSPNGFPNRTDSTISYNAGTRTFSISPSVSSYWFYSSGVKYTKTVINSIVWPNVEGQHFFYFDSSGVLQTTSIPSNISDVILNNAFVAAIYWDATNSSVVFFAEERHKFMDPEVHRYLHLTAGAQWVSGGGLTNFVIGNGSLDSHAQFEANTTSIVDEDISYTITDGSPQDLSPILIAPVFYLSGSTPVWRSKTPDNFVVIQSGSAGYTGPNGRIAYNRNNAGTWQLSEVGQSNYSCVHVFATNNINNPYVAILGQSEYGNVPDATAGSRNELIGLSYLNTIFAQEMVPIGTILFQTSTTYNNSVKARIVQTSDGGNYIDWRGNKFKTIAGSSGQIGPTGPTGPAGVNIGGVLFFGADSAGTTTTTRYLYPGYALSLASTNDIYRINAPKAGTLKNLSIRSNTPSTSPLTITYTVMVNGVASSLSVSMAANVNSGSNNVNTVAINSGDNITIRITKALSISPAVSQIVASVELS